MGKIRLIVEGSTVGTVANGGGVVIDKDVADGDSTRLVMAYARTYAGKWLDENGNPRQPTIAEVLDAWFDGIVNGSIAHVLAVEKEVAAETARANVQPITVT